MVMLQRWFTLMEGEWSYYRGGQFKGGRINGGRMVMLQRWSVQYRKNCHITEVVSLVEREWLCYRNRQFNGG